MTTLSPLAAKAEAIASPMPLVDPVTTTDLFMLLPPWSRDAALQRQSEVMLKGAGLAIGKWRRCAAATYTLPSAADLPY
jgi:hypothetical protein